MTAAKHAPQQCGLCGAFISPGATGACASCGADWNNGPNAAKHTPQRWHAPGLGEIHDADHNIVADSVGREDHARLIAAAPQMAEALRQIAEYSAPCGFDEIVEMARKALTAAGIE